MSSLLEQRLEDEVKNTVCASMFTANAGAAKMITLIDSTGREVDSSSYRERLKVPADKQVEIREWVAKAEEKINDCRDSKQVMSFLRRFTYTQNLLDQPYQSQTATLTAITPYAKLYRSSGDSAEAVNQKMYHLEKVARLGIPVELTPEDVRIISQVEDYYYEAENEKKLRLIKMLGRHAKLGLPDIDPPRKKHLQEMLLEAPFIFLDWIECSALRAGFVVPPCPVKGIENRIKGYIEQEPENLAEILTFEYRIFGQEQQRKMMESDVKIDVYVNGWHHLKRLFGED